MHHNRYDPRAIVTEGGAMKITLSRDQNHDLNYTGGLVNTWNKFCFTEGYVEGKPGYQVEASAAMSNSVITGSTVSLSLPGTSDVYG